MRLIMKQIIIVIISLIFVSCAGLPFPPESTGKTAQTHTFGKEIAEDNRWIDMEDIIELITYSDTGSVKVSDVIRFLGEPVYIERYDNEGKIQTDLHYKFKTKLV